MDFLFTRTDQVLSVVGGIESIRKKLFRRANILDKVKQERMTSGMLGNAKICIDLLILFSTGAEIMLLI